jgi:hypothetical protein
VIERFPTAANPGSAELKALNPDCGPKKDSATAISANHELPVYIPRGSSPQLAAALTPGRWYSPDAVPCVNSLLPSTEEECHPKLNMHSREGL